MPIKNNENFTPISHKFAQQEAAKPSVDYTKPTVHEYFDPHNLEALNIAAKKMAERVREHKPLTPLIPEYPMPHLSLDEKPTGEAELNQSTSLSFHSNSEARRSLSSPLFFTPIAQATDNQERSARFEQQQPTVQGSGVSALRKLRTIPRTTALETFDDMLDSHSHELAELTNALSTANEQEHFAGAAILALRRTLFRPLALNLTALASIASSPDPDSSTPLAPRLAPKAFCFTL